MSIRSRSNDIFAQDILRVHTFMHVFFSTSFNLWTLLPLMTMCIFFILYLWVPTYIAQLTLLFVFMYILIFEGVKLNVYHADIDNNIITLPILIICTMQAS